MAEGIISLVSELSDGSEEKLDLFATVEGIGQKEFFAASQTGLKPEYRVVVWQSDYDGQAVAEFNNRRYSIYRTYPREEDKLELYLALAAGV